MNRVNYLAGDNMFSDILNVYTFLGVFILFLNFCVLETTF